MSSATTTQTGYLAAPALAEVLPPAKQRGRAMTFVRRHPAIVIGGVLLGAMVFIAIFAPYLGTVDPTALAPAKRTREPSATYWFGTDMLGRDVYSRVMYGARVSLTVGFSVALLSSVVGSFIVVPQIARLKCNRPSKNIRPKADVEFAQCCEWKSMRLRRSRRVAGQ